MNKFLIEKRIKGGIRTVEKVGVLRRVEALKGIKALLLLKLELFARLWAPVNLFSSLIGLIRGLT